MPGSVLILAGTGLARRLCARVADCDVLASLAGVTEVPADLAVPVRTGGFGGEAGFRAALGGIAAVLDATHPFAVRISGRTARVCAEMGLPLLRLEAPPWPDDPSWHRYANADAVANALPAGARVFLSTGPGSLDPFLGRGFDLFCRRIDPAPAREGVHWIVGRPPFATPDERALFASLRITDLVTKDSGGARAKLDAAAELGVAVHVIDRPPPGAVTCETTDDLDRAEAFVRAHAAGRPPGGADHPR
ncbi:precorrin-6A/cobalt-precorrin-6A reductase [Jannaschia sp. S6380]|uniref:precorrin-6A/cobalt-precorrin-6A reductase n=1 Tax=Jannaschia sp. S6380 TaxID=2926408 RepID=UPI001FF63416|nr:precorrin-6A/cobalt-precorrin-6A reductase [Jannaschia sp. S6380]MCK0166415.1 precorrin-6A/cobalt-precorrin-6A reductase [Jannaschia sp. S6380]